jgi:hypothetical protein
LNAQKLQSLHLKDWDNLILHECLVGKPFWFALSQTDGEPNSMPVMLT